MPRTHIRPTIYRTRLAKDIVAEVALPPKQTGKVIVLASGLPSIPSKRAVLEFLVGEGYTVVFPRYRGTWESDGYFLEHSPTTDILEVMNVLARQQQFWCTFSATWIPLRVKKFYLIGSSFGGPAVLNLSGEKMVHKVAVLSPVLDWQNEFSETAFREERRFIAEGFGMATRLRTSKDWNKLLDPNFYSAPKSFSPAVKKKIFLIHCFDDEVVSIAPAIEAVNSKMFLSYYFKPHGGHLGLSHITQLFFWHKIKNFFDA